MSWKWILFEENCTSCGICADVCEENALKMTEKDALPQVFIELCKGCMTCVNECPFNAIMVEEDSVSVSK